MPIEPPPPIIVADNAALRHLAHHLATQPLIAVDTESNSLYAYREQVCLMQISTRERDWIVDTLAVRDLSPLADIFASPHVEKVFHAAEYDLMCMKRDYQFQFAGLFDTMISARIIGRKLIGLGNLLEEYFDVRVNKKFQRANWALRPIPAEQLRYAQHDTHYLPRLRDILRELLEKQGRLVEAREVFGELCEVPAAEQSFDPDGYWRMNAARDLPLRQMAVLRELYLLRDQLARQRNVPAFKVMSDDALVNIVLTEPTQPADLLDLHGVGHRLADKHSGAILAAVQRGLTARLPQRPDMNNRTDPDTAARFDALHRWRKERAARRGVESDVIIPKDALWQLARHPVHTLDELATVPGLGPWKREQYGAELLNVLANVETG